MCGLSGDVAGFPQTSLVVDVLYAPIQEGSCSDVLGSFHHRLQCLMPNSSDAAIPDCDAACQDALHSGPVDVAEELLWQVDSPQPSEEVEVRLGVEHGLKGAALRVSCAECGGGVYMLSSSQTVVCR